MFNPNELDGFKDQEVTKSGNFLSKGLHIVKMIDYKFENPPKGCPFFICTIKDDKEYTSTVKIYRERDGDDENKRKNKRESLKRFFLAAGADFNIKDPGAFVNSALNNEFQVVLKDEEYIGYGNLNKPEIKRITKYNFAEPIVDENGIKKEVRMQEKYTYQPLKPNDRKKFEFELSEWQSKNPSDPSSGASTPPPQSGSGDDDDDLPF